MERLVDWLDGVPLGSVIAFGGMLVSIIGVVGALFALVTGQISYAEFAATITATSVGGGVLAVGGGKIGQARNVAGKSVRLSDVERVRLGFASHED